ncbi:MAG: flavoprotein [Phycisphaerales bacterium]
MTLDPSELKKTFDGREILIGISGGIAVYKVCTVVSRLAQAGAGVTVLMTKAATHFVQPLTFQALSGRPVYTSPWQHSEAHDPQHIAIADRCDVALVAPCTMDMMGKLVIGRTDDVVSLALSAIDRSKTPVLLAPAMNDAMWNQASTQRNAAQLEQDNFGLVGPGNGWQACRHVGTGRMVEPEDLVEALKRAISG